MGIKHILVSDIGGTNGRFAHFSYNNETKELVLVQSVVLLFDTLENEFNIFNLLEQLNFDIKVDDFDIFSFAIAGPVTGRKARLANNPLVVDIDDLERRFKGKPVKVLNDFAAQAYAVLSPLETSYTTIRDGVENAAAPLAIIGAGTGLGHAYIIRNISANGETTNIVMPSERGHVAFAPQNKKEMDFSEFVKSRLNVSYVISENVLSGNGLSLLHEFLTGEKLTPQQVAKGFSSEKHKETLAWFAGFYGRVARDYTLGLMALGGVFISGGIAIKNPQIITHEAFLTNYTDTAIAYNFLKTVPIKLMSSEDNGLWGAAEFGIR